MAKSVTLRTLLDPKRLSPQDALTFITQICSALQYAHDQGFVHRDIKPENILIDLKGQVKIVDFGLAMMLEPSRGHVTLTERVGSPHYMAPEQLERPQEVDHRADLYSLGVIFYEMLTGELPIGRFAPPSQKIVVDVRLDEVVLKTLEKEPHLRYQRARDLKTDIESIKIESIQPKPLFTSAAVERRFRRATGLTLLLCALWAILFFAAAWIEAIQSVLGGGSSAQSQLLTLNLALILACGAWWFSLLLKKYDLAEKLLSWSLQKRLILAISAAMGLWLVGLKVGDSLNPEKGFDWVLLAGVALGPGAFLSILWWAARKEVGEPIFTGHSSPLLAIALLVMMSGYAFIMHSASVGFALQAAGSLLYLVAMRVRFKASRITGKKAARIFLHLVVFFILGALAAGIFSKDLHADIRTFLFFPAALFLALTLIFESALKRTQGSLREVHGFKDPFTPELFYGWLLFCIGTLSLARGFPLGPSRELETTMEIPSLEAISTVSQAARTTLAVAKDGNIELLDEEGKRTRILAAKGEAHLLAWSVDGSLLAAGDRTFSIWEAATGRLLHTLRPEAPGYPVPSLCFSPDGEKLAMGRRSGVIEIWDLRSVRRIASWKGHLGEVRVVLFHPDGKHFASGSRDGAVKFWDATSGRSLETLDAEFGDVRSLAFSPSGQQLVIGAAGVTVFDLEGRNLPRQLTGSLVRKASQRLKKVVGHSLYPVRAVAFSPDGKIVAASTENAIELWEAASGRWLTKLKGHGEDVGFLAFTPTGKMVSASRGF